MSKYYFAVDVETDGLLYDETGSVRKSSLLQLCYRILDQDMNVLMYGNGYIKDHGCDLMKMDPYVFNMHCNSGVIQNIQSGNSIYREDYEDSIITNIENVVGSGDVLIPMGNNVQFDVEVIRRAMPKVFKKFHYSYFDVSCMRNILDNTFPGLAPKIHSVKGSNHNAEKDIDECIREYKIYKQLLTEMESTTKVMRDYISAT